MALRKTSFICAGVIITAGWAITACGDDANTDAAAEPSGGTGGTSDEETPGDDETDPNGCNPAECEGINLGPVSAEGCCKDDGTCGYDASMLGMGCVNQDDLGDLTGSGGGGGTGSGNGGGGSSATPDPDCETVSLGSFADVEGCCLDSGLCGYIVPDQLSFTGLSGCVGKDELPSWATGQLPEPGPCGSGAGGSGAGGSGAGGSGAGGSGAGGSGGSTSDP